MDPLQSNTSRTFTVNPNSLDNDSHLFYLLSVPCFHDNCNSSIFGANLRHTNASNSGSDDQEYTGKSTAELIVLGILAGSTILVTIAGNFVVLFSFLLESSIRQPTNYFIASLSVSDLLIGTISMPFYTVYLLAGKSWPLGEVLCDLWLSVDYTVCLSSIYTVLGITIDRFCSIKIPAKYRKWRTERKVTIIIAIIWTIPVLVFFPSIFGWQYFVGVRTVAKGKCYVQYMESAIFNVLLQLGYFWITMVVMCSLYSGIYQVALNLQRKSEAKWRQTASLVSVAGKAVTQLGIRVTTSQPPDQRPDKSNPVGDGSCRSEEERITPEKRPDQKPNNIGSGFRDNNKREQRSSECSSDTDTSEVKGQATTSAKVRPNNCPHQPQQKTSKRKLSWKQRNAEKKLLAKSHLPPSVLPIICSPLLPNRSSMPPLPGKLVSPLVSARLDGQQSVPDDLVRFGTSSTPPRTFSLKSSGSGLHNGLNARQRRTSEYFPPNTPIMSSCLPRRSSIAPQPSLEGGIVYHQQENPSDSTIGCTVLNEVPSDDVSCLSFNRRGSTRRRKSSTKQPRTNNSLESIDSLKVEVSGRRTSVTPDSPIWIRRSSIVLKPPSGNSSTHLSTDNTYTRTSSKSSHLDDDAEAGLKRANGRNNYDGVEASVETESDVKTSTSSGTFFRRRRAKFRKTLSTTRTCRRPRSFGRSWSASRLFCLRRRRGPVVPDQRPKGGGRETPGAPSREPSKRENRARKALRTITIILGAFVVCWTPWHILSMIYGFCPTCVDADLYDVSYWLCYLNSPINPFCYAFANPQFKKTFLRIFRLDWRRS